MYERISKDIDEKGVEKGKRLLPQSTLIHNPISNYASYDVRVVQKLRYPIDKVPDTEGDEVFWDTRRKRYYSGMAEIPPSESTMLAIPNSLVKESAIKTSEAMSSFSHEQNRYVADGLKERVLLEFDENHFVEANQTPPRLYNGGQVSEYADHKGYAEFRKTNNALGTAGTFGIELEMVGIPWDYDIGNQSIDQINERTFEGINLQGNSMGSMLKDLSESLKGRKYNQWKTDFDGTVQDGGGMGLELVSPILEDEQEAWEGIEAVYEAIEKYGGKYNPTCSGHIHFGVKTLGKKEDNWDNLFLLYRAAQDVIAIIAQSGQKELREGVAVNAPPFSAFSPELLEEIVTVPEETSVSAPEEGAGVPPVPAKANSVVNDEYKKFVPSNLIQIYERTTGREWKGNIDDDRHSPVNIFSLFTDGDKKKPTVEFRIFNFPETKEALQANVFLSNAIMQAAKKPKEEVREFLNLLFKKKNLEERAMYLFDFITEKKEDYLLLWKAFRYNQAQQEVEGTAGE